VVQGRRGTRSGLGTKTGENRLPYEKPLEKGEVMTNVDAGGKKRRTSPIRVPKRQKRLIVAKRIWGLRILGGIEHRRPKCGRGAGKGSRPPGKEAKHAYGGRLYHKLLARRRQRELT